MTFHKVLFWLHLCTGVVAGIVVLMMSVTGVLLMYEKQMTAWADRKYRVTPPSPAATRLPVETLLSKVREYRSALPSTLTLRSDPAEPAALGFGRESIVYLNPYTGEILGEGSKGIRTFFHVVTDWHRWLGSHGENRAIARAITGACNLGFLFLVISGFCIWWPKQWTRPQLRNVTWFRRGLPGKARDFNWHNVIGFWSAVPLFIVVLSATVISYPWASNLVYRLVGEVPPPQGGLAGQSGSARQASSTGGPQRTRSNTLKENCLEDRKVHPVASKDSDLRDGQWVESPAPGAKVPSAWVDPAVAGPWQDRRRIRTWMVSTGCGPARSNRSPVGAASACGCQAQPTSRFCHSRSTKAMEANPRNGPNLP